MGMKLKISHIECHPECLVIVFSGQYEAVCEREYCLLQKEIQCVFKGRADVYVGGCCLVKDKDGTWHRGRILGKRENTCDVFLLDTGQVLVVEKAHLASAHAGLFQLPPKVVLGVFASLLPLGEKWSPKAINYFSSLVGLEITGHVKAVLPYQVFILEAPKIIDDVLELQLGKRIDGDSFCLIVKMFRVLPQEMLCKRVPRLLQQKYAVEELLPFSSFEKPADFCLVPHNLFPRVPVGSKENVKITLAVSPNKFYCQIQKWQKELEDLTGAMHLYYEAIGRENNKSSDSLGVLCAAKRQNGQWCRGVIKEVLPDHVEVWFMDLGVTEVVPSSCIQKLEEEFMVLPMSSFPCALYCFRGQDEKGTKVQLKELTQALIGQTPVCVRVDLFDDVKHLYYITLQNQNHGINAKHPENLNEAAASLVSLLEKPCQKKDSSFTTCAEKKPTETPMPQCDISLSSHYKRLEMKVGSFYTAFVVRVIHPSLFWIQPCEYQEECQALMKNIADTYNLCEAEEMILKNPKPGVLCCAQYSKDLCYYRGVVIEVLPEAMTVYFLDFGYRDTVPCHCVKTLLPKFSDLPALAMCCGLACTVPSAEVWTDKAIDFFRKMVFNKVLLLHVVEKETDNYTVNALYRNDCCLQDVAVRMDQAGCAYYSEKVSGSVLDSPEKSQTWSPWKPKEEKVNARIFQKEKLPSMPSVQIQYRMLPGGRRGEIYQCIEENLFYKELVFKPGAVLEVVCSCVASPSDFSCQLQSKLPELNNLMDQIQTYYNKHSSPYQNGQVACIVKCHRDGKWYRGTVVQQVSRKKVEVVFVDYGYRRIVLLKDLRAVIPHFLTLESQAFRCGLKNVPLQTNDLLNFSEEVHRHFEEFFYASREPLTCIVYAVVSVSPNCLCNIVDIKTPSVSAEEFLRERGLTQSECIGLTNLASLGSLHSFCYSSFNIKTGSEEEVCIAHVHSPSKFYCQLNRNAATLKALMKKVSFISEMPNNAKYGTGNARLCIARYFEDGLFYRALAFPVASTSFLSVDFVDFGNQSMVERDQLIPIPDSATDLIFTPMQAIKCCLSDFRERNIPAGVARWFEKTFRGKVLKALIVSRESDGQIIVELYDGQLKISQKMEEKILEELAPKNHAERFVRSNEGTIRHVADDKKMPKATVKNPERVEVKPDLKCQASDRYYRTDTEQNFGDEGQTACSTLKLCSGSSKQLALQNSEEEPDFTNTVSAVLEHREEPLVGEPASLSVYPPALNSKQITGCHNERLNDASQQERSNANTPKINSLPQRDLQVNSEEAGCISHVNSPSSFYVQLADDENLIIQLAEELNESMAIIGDENFLDELSVGDLIVAERDTDCFYYRAVIKTLKSGNSFEVEFIDYGNTGVVSASKICRIQKKLLTLPRLSVHCFLRVNGVPGDSWTDEITSYFQSKVTNKTVACKFLKQHGEQWEIDVICDGKSLSDDLLQKKGRTRFQNTPMHNQGNRCKQILVPNGSPEDTKSRNDLGGWSKAKSLRIKPASKPPFEIYPVIPGHIERAQVTNISERGEFHVQLHRTSQMLHKLNATIVKEAEQSGLLRVDDIEEGLECLTKSERTLKWYRSKVIKKFVREKLMLFFSLDYGHCEMVSLNNAKMLSDEMRCIPKQALFCKWVGFEKLKTMQYVHVLNALRDHEITILFLDYLTSSHVHEVDIVVGDILLQKYLNQLLDPCWTIGPEKSSNRDCKEFDRACKISTSTWTLLQNGREYAGLPTAVTDPSDFYIQFEVLLDCTQDLPWLLYDLPDDLPALPKELVTPGASCLIRSGLEAQWKRVEITEVTSQSVVLRCIDFGVLKRIPCSDIHKLKALPESLSFFPRLAYRCSLHDTVPATGERWSDEAKLLFHKLLSKPGLTFHFKHYGSEMKLEVDAVYKENNLNLADALIDAGHAVRSEMRCCLLPLERLKSLEPDWKHRRPVSSYSPSF